MTMCSGVSKIHTESSVQPNSRLRIQRKLDSVQSQSPPTKDKKQILRQIPFLSQFQSAKGPETKRILKIRFNVELKLQQERAN